MVYDPSRYSGRPPHPNWGARPSRNGRQPSLAEPVHIDAHGPEKVISVDFDGTIVEPRTAFKKVAYKPALLLSQIAHFTGAVVISHSPRHTMSMLDNNSEVMGAFNSAGVCNLPLYSEWVAEKKAGEPAPDFAERWKNGHSGTQKIVFVDFNTFARTYRVNPDVARVTSEKGFQTRHARRVVEALGSNWEAFKIYRRKELQAIRKNPDHLKRPLFRRPGA